MPSKKKKYNARFPAGRIKKIMQTDEEVGKVAQAVPVIISRTLELFVESLLTKSMHITQSRNAKTMTPSHMKQCILSESRFDFLKDLVKDIPDASTLEDNENNAIEALDYSLSRVEAPDAAVQPQKEDRDAAVPLLTEQSTSTSRRAPVIHYSPKVTTTDPPPLNYSVENLVRSESKIQVDLTTLPTLVSASQPLPVSNVNNSVPNIEKSSEGRETVPQLIPLAHNLYSQSTGDSLFIDEDYDN